MSTSICVACPTSSELTTNRNMEKTYETASSSTHCANGDDLIENQTVFVIALQPVLFIKVRRPTCLLVCEQLTSLGKSTLTPSFSNIPSGLGDNASSRERSVVFLYFLFGVEEDVFETSEVIMPELANSRARNLQVDAMVGDNDVPTLCRYHARNCRETLRVENRSLSTEEVCYVTFKVHVNICEAKPLVDPRSH